MVTARSAIKIVRVCADTGAASVFARIENCPATYIHSFAMTPKYIVVIVGSIRVNTLSLMFHRTLTKGLHFDEKAKTRIHLVCRRTGQHVSTHTAGPSFALHTVNAFDSGPREVTLDLCHYKSTDCLTGLMLSDLVEGSSEFEGGVLATYVLPNIGEKSRLRVWETPEAIETHHSALPSIELPVIHPARKSNRHRFIYGVTTAEEEQAFGGVVKIDRGLGTSVVYRNEGKYVSEPIFVPRPACAEGSCWGTRAQAAAEEDDGVLVFAEVDGRSAVTESALVILDAKTMTEVARCVSAVTIPFTFHGHFMPDDE